MPFFKVASSFLPARAVTNMLDILLTGITRSRPDLKTKKAMIRYPAFSGECRRSQGPTRKRAISRKGTPVLGRLYVADSFSALLYSVRVGSDKKLALESMNEQIIVHESPQEANVWIAMRPTIVDRSCNTNMASSSQIPELAHSTRLLANTRRWDRRAEEDRYSKTFEIANALVHNISVRGEGIPGKTKVAQKSRANTRIIAKTTAPTKKTLSPASMYSN